MSSVTGISIGIYEKALPPATNWGQRLAFAAHAGFDFLELSLDPSAERLSRLAWTEAQRHELRYAVEQSGVPVRTMCLSAHRDYPLGCGDPVVRARGMQILRQAIDLAASVGIRIVQVAGYDVLPGEVSNAESRKRYVDALRQGVAWAAERAVLLGLENQEVGYIDSPSTAVEVGREVDSPYLRLYSDVGNLIVKGLEPLGEIDAAQGQLIGVHVKDARLGVPRRVPFGEGEVPFDAIFRRLKAQGFYGPMMIEMWNDDRPDALDVIADARRWIETKLVTAGYAASAPAGG
jgi:predicted hexulose-6-phosphate isomerase